MMLNKQGDKLTYCVSWAGSSFKPGSIYKLLDNLKAINELGYISHFTVDDYYANIFRRPYKNELKLVID